MKTRHAFILGLLTSTFCLPAFSQSTAFTYQGKLEYNSAPANGSFDLIFSVWNGAAGPSQVGSTVTNLNVSVSNGLATTKLDFGASVFTGQDRWLEIGIRTNGGSSYTIVAPRQQITPTPYAMNIAGGTLGDASLSTNVALLNRNPQTFTGGTNVFNGRVGIGSTSPNHRLRIAGGSPFWTSAFWSGSLELDNAAAIGWQANASGNRFGIGQSSGGLYVFATGSDPGNTGNPANYLMTFDDFGRVGIGTTTPANRLTVSQAGYGIEHTDGNIRVGTYAGSGAGWYGTLNNFPLSFFVNGGTAKLTIDTDGNTRVNGRLSVNRAATSTVAIQADAAFAVPIIIYDSSGNELLRVQQGSPGYLSVTGDAYKTSGGTAWSIPSDVRVKQDVEDYESGLDEILQLRPVRFHYRDDLARGLNSQNEEIGFVAQEVRDAIPEAVTEAKDGYLSLKADPIHWAAINAIKELNEKLEQKDSRINALEQQLAELKQAVDKLSNHK